MIRKEVEVKPIKVIALCECGGEFKRTTTLGTLATYPTQYPHVCDKCGKHETFFVCYPTIEYKEVE